MVPLYYHQGHIQQDSALNFTERIWQKRSPINIKQCLGNLSLANNVARVCQFEKIKCKFVAKLCLERVLANKVL